MATETKTVVFTDMVGSTEQRVRLGDAEADALLGEHNEIVQRAAAGHGGRVVEGTGDGVMLAFDGAADAVHASVAIQQAIEQRNGLVAQPIGLRIGVSLGDLASDGESLHGLAAHEAARVCALGGAGEVLVSDVVRLVAGSRLDARLVEHGTHELKGIVGPVTVWSVLWEPSVAAGPSMVPLQARLAAESPTAFVGRASERERLETAHKETIDGKRRVVLISGEPGIGKTALASAFARQVFSQGDLVLYGRSDEDLGIPYQPWLEVLTHLVRHTSEDVLSAHTLARGGELARLVPELTARVHAEVPSGAGEERRYLLFGAVVDLLARVAANGPVVIVLDDLHWADKPTLQLLRHLVSVEDSLPLLVIGTFRGSEVGADDSLGEILAALHREPGVQRLALHGLGDDELLALLEAIAGQELDGDALALRDALLDETEGNPFFVGEMLRHLAETGALYQEEGGRWAASNDLRASGLPISIREVVSRRIDRLGPEAHRVLPLASVVGRDFELQVLLEVAEIDEDTLIRLCDEAVAAAVLNETDRPGRYTFAHGLIERTLYDSLSGARRARAHRSVAQAVEAMCGGEPGARVGELAYHWARATLPDVASQAVDYAQQAGDRALAQLAPDEAARWYTEVLDLLDRTQPPDNRRRAVVLAALGDAQRQAGSPAHRETLLAAALLAADNNDTDTLVRAALANNRGFFSLIGAVDNERVDVLRLALERLGDSDAAARAQLLATLCTELVFGEEFDQRLLLAEESVAVARSSCNATVLADVLARTYYGIYLPETRDLRIAWTTEACELADEAHPTQRHLAYAHHGTASLEAGNIEAFDASMQVVADVASYSGQPFQHWRAEVYHAVRYIIEGNLQSAEEAATQALEMGLELQPDDATIIYGAAMLTIRLFQTGATEMVPFVDQLRQSHPEFATIRAVECAVAAETGDHDRAVQLLDTAFGEGLATPTDATWLITNWIWSLAAARTHHKESAGLLLERLRPWSDHHVTLGVTYTGSTMHILGMLSDALGHDEDADAYFAQALQAHERVGAPAFAAWTKVLWGRFLLSRDRPEHRERGTQMIASALTVARENGYSLIERDASPISADGS